MAIQLVVTDLDGTLLSYDRKISDDAVNVIEKWKEHGGKFSFITGRPLPAVLKFAERVNVNAPLVCCNGAELAEIQPKHNEMIMRCSMKLLRLRKLMEAAHSAGLTVLYYSGGQEYAMGITEWVAQRRSRGEKNSSYPIQEHSEAFWENTCAEKVNIMVGNQTEKGKRLLPYINELKEEFHIVLYEDFGCEITHKGCNKAAGLQKLISLLDIPMEEVMVLGDNENDLEMLREAGLGVAVGNATKEAKAAADYICTAEYTEGVIEAIRKFCLRDREDG